MKKILIIALCTIFSTIANATIKDSTIIYNLPDSVKAVQFMSEITVQAFNEKRYFSAGIKTDAVSLSLTKYVMGKRGIQFVFPAYSLMPAIGLNVGKDRRFADLGFTYDWKIGETYKLLISQATDSVGNYSLYSGYVFLPRENKWKLIGSCKIEGRSSTIQKPAYYCYSRGKKEIIVNSGQVWIQRSNGSWKNMKNETFPNPTINLFGHIDSVQQRQIDIKLIESAIASDKTDTKDNVEGIYYKMMKKGTGIQVSVNDTVVAFYKGYLLNDGLVFDQTKDTPATFPLKRLIKGWQIGVPLCKVGGKIKLVIPSDLAYSIRTRSAKIPPNSILVFEIEVIDVKPPL